MYMVTVVPRRKHVLLSAITALFWMGSAFSQGDVVAYPKQGQSSEQQSRDRYECHMWAVRQSGFDPSNPQQAQGSGGSAAGGTAKETLRGGARGGAAGAAIGAIAGDAGKGAAIGATAGAFKRRFSEKDRQRAGGAGTSNAGQDSYRRALSACLDGRGYSVK